MGSSVGIASWLGRLFGRGDAEECAPASGQAAESLSRTSPAPEPESSWEELEAYVPVDPDEHRAAVVIASAIAAGANPETSLEVRSVKIANPEYQRVACIASAIAAGALESSSFKITRICKMKDTEGAHAA